MDVDAGEEGGRAGRVDHSTFGARYAVEIAAKTIGQHASQVLAFSIAGHHCGLANAIADSAESQKGSLTYRLKPDGIKIPKVEDGSFELGIPPLKLPYKPDPNDLGFPLAFFTRMIFSALVDADRLATEKFCDPNQAELRGAQQPTIAQLLIAVTSHLDALSAKATLSPVNQIRASVRVECRAAAGKARGFFSLNVPTGGGKTLAAMEFALRHASLHDLRRVVVATPFTTIIEQTADVYREAFGRHAEFGLVEHHCNVEPSRDTRANKLGAENWDAPIVVTTNVQILESLFAAKTTPCRKLHRLANSVIVFDEVQTLPVELLNPTLRALRELVEHYSCSIVLCTATQPALEKCEEFPIGFEGVRPIIRDAPALFHSLQRVDVGDAGKLSDDDLIERLLESESVLCVVNTRSHAAKLFEGLQRKASEGSFHLSTNMCAAHRRNVVAEIRKRLHGKDVCRVVSTQLIEAGVDLDFDTVYRAPAGFDSVAQAAGRCNREGRLHRGKVWLFETEARPPAGFLRESAQIAQELGGLCSDRLAPDAIREYFRLLYWLKNDQWDRHEIMSLFCASRNAPNLAFQFRTAAERYRLIRDEQTPVLVAYDETARALRDRMSLGEACSFIDFRVAQRYQVGVYSQTKRALQIAGAIQEHSAGSGLWLLQMDRAYTSEMGLSIAAARLDAEDLVL